MGTINSCLTFWLLWIILGITIVSYAFGYIGKIHEGFAMANNAKLKELDRQIGKYLNLVSPGSAEANRAIQLQQTIASDLNRPIDTRQLLSNEINDLLYQYSNKNSSLTRKDYTENLRDLNEAIQYFLDLMSKNKIKDSKLLEAVDTGEKLKIRVQAQLKGQLDSNDPTRLTSSQVLREIQKFQTRASEALNFIDQQSSRATKIAILPTTSGSVGNPTITENELYETEKKQKEDIDPAEILAIDESPQPAGASYDAAFFTPIWGINPSTQI